MSNLPQCENLSRMLNVVFSNIHVFRTVNLVWLFYSFYNIIHWLLNYFHSIKIITTFFFFPDGEGRGGSDPLQVPQGEPGQRLLRTTGCTQTEIWAAGLYVLSVYLYLHVCIVSLPVCIWCSQGKASPASIIVVTLLSFCCRWTLGLLEPGDWHPFGIVLLFLPICSTWLISHKWHALD